MVHISEIQNIKNRFSIIGNSSLLDRAIEIAMKVAPTDMTVLVNGESGVGKEAFSKIIHHLSKRKHGPFIAINCGAIPSGTIDSELFGHEKGSFTSAHDMRKGYFETVSGGTIFLDEIGELPLETQSRLLRVLESGEFFKVGSSKVQKTDVRIIAATNKDLLQQTQANKFREDLFYRLSTVTIKIPSLRERKEDIPMLFSYFAAHFADKYRMPHLEMTPAAEQVLMSYRWQGNIRQLRNIVEQVSILESERKLTAELISKYLPEVPRPELAISGNSGENKGFDNFTEREIMFKFLFEIKKDISELKEMMGTILRSPVPAFERKEAAEQASNLHHRLLAAGNFAAQVGDVYNPFRNQPNDEAEEFIDAEEKQEVLSLTEIEKEMIRKALQKFSGKRKPAADELGISERTLYRKIKEYNLEDA